MKRRTLTLCIFCLLCTAFLAACGQSGTEALGNGVAQHGNLRVEGVRLLNEKGEPVVLRGVSTHGIAWYPRYLNGGAMQTLREKGANLLRIAMYTEPSGAYIEDPERSLDYLYLGIESALAEDMYVIVDWHILKDENPNEFVEEAVAFFDEISAHYCDEPGIIYEICNEPNGDTTWEDVVAYAQRVIPVIRANAPNAVILVGVPNYCTDFSGPLEDPLPEENIMYSLHRYIDVTTPEVEEFPYLERLLKKGLPIFVSEWGVSVEGEDESDPDAPKKLTRPLYMEAAQPFLDSMKELQVSWAAWALSNKHETHSILHASSQKLSGWTDEDLTGFGKLIFNNF